MVNNLQLGELSVVTQLSVLCKGRLFNDPKKRENIQISFIPNSPLQQMIRVFKFQTPE